MLLSNTKRGNNYPRLLRGTSLADADVVGGAGVSGNARGWAIGAPVAIRGDAAVVGVSAGGFKAGGAPFAGIGGPAARPGRLCRQRSRPHAMKYTRSRDPYLERRLYCS